MPQATTKPAPLHTDSMLYAARTNDGKIPTGWNEAASESVAKANVIAAIAWEQVRCFDPPFPACSYSHREKLIAEVEAILKSGPPTTPTAFTDACCIIIADINHADRLRLVGETVEGEN